MVYKLLKETEEENLYICDGKNDELYELYDYLKLSNVENRLHRVGETVRKIENHGANRYDSKERDASGIFLLLMSLLH